MEIEKRRLGRSDLMVSPIGLGCWQFSKGKGMTGKYWGSLSDENIAEIVDLSIKGGINWFDTAEIYGKGESERALAKALGNLHIRLDQVIIATKWWPIFRTARSITGSIQKRLEALNVSRIDLYQVHNPLSFSSVSAQMNAMAQLVSQTLVRYVGVSNFSASAMRKAHHELEKQGLFLTSNQMEFNLLNRSIEKNGVLETARELGITIIAYSPLAQGLLTGKFHDNPQLLKDTRLFRRIYSSIGGDKLERSRPVVNLLKELADKYDSTPAQIALNWAINVHGEQIVVIPGASKPSHAKENTLAMGFSLSEEDIERLNRKSQAYAG